MILELLKNKTASEQATIKGIEIAKITSHLTTTYGKYKMDIFDVSPIEGGIEFYAKAWDLEGNPISLGTGVETEHYRIFNPPILVDDVNGDVIKTYIDEDGNTKEHRFREDVVEVLLSSLEHTISVSNKGINPKKGSVGSTTSTFYPDAGIPGTNSVDGFISRGPVDEAWATITGAATGTNIGGDLGNTAIVRFTSSGTSNQWARLYRSVLTFLTSAIPDTDTISSGVLSIYGTSKLDEFGTPSLPNIDIYSLSLAANNDIVEGDYDGFGTTSFTGSPISYADWNTVGYNDFNLLNPDDGKISKTGVSPFGARNANHDVAGSAPTWSSGANGYLNGYYADNGSNQPKLVVVHSGVQAGGGIHLLNLMGCGN